MRQNRREILLCCAMFFFFLVFWLMVRFPYETVLSNYLEKEVLKHGIKLNIIGLKWEFPGNFSCQKTIIEFKDFTISFPEDDYFTINLKIFPLLKKKLSFTARTSNDSLNFMVDYDLKGRGKAKINLNSFNLMPLLEPMITIAGIPDVSGVAMVDFSLTNTYMYDIESKFAFNQNILDLPLLQSVGIQQVNFNELIVSLLLTSKVLKVRVFQLSAKEFLAEIAGSVSNPFSHNRNAVFSSKITLKEEALTSEDWELPRLFLEQYRATEDTYILTLKGNDKHWELEKGDSFNSL